jgi:hypothetical protein
MTGPSGELDVFQGDDGGGGHASLHSAPPGRSKAGDIGDRELSNCSTRSGGGGGGGGAARSRSHKDSGTGGAWSSTGGRLELHGARAPARAGDLERPPPLVRTLRRGVVEGAAGLHPGRGGGGGRARPGSRARQSAVSREHEVAPDVRRDIAADHAVHRPVVVVAHPHARRPVGGEAHEPGVAPALAGAGLAGAGRPMAPPAPVPLWITRFIMPTICAFRCGG